jgi:pre-mRNA-processing factor SLU7
MFAWEAARKGLDVHMLAEPTKLEALKSEFETKKGEFKSQMDKSILEKYGGQEHLEAPPRYGTVNTEEVIDRFPSLLPFCM